MSNTVTLAGQTITADEALDLLRRHLGSDPAAKAPWYEPIASELLLRAAAERAGVPLPTSAELQTGVDEVRRAVGLHSAADTEAWLEANHMSLEDLEEGVTTNILADRWADKMVGDRLAAEFPDLAPQARRLIRTILMEPFLEAERVRYGATG